MKESMPLWEAALGGCGKNANKMREIYDKIERIKQRSDWD